MLGRQRNFIVGGNDRTQTNGIIKNERRAINFIVAGNDGTQTKVIIEKL